MNVTVSMNEAMVADLKRLAERNLPQDTDEDFNAFDWSGGNFDDAEDLGYKAGETYLARTILTAFNIPYTDPSK